MGDFIRSFNYSLDTAGEIKESAPGYIIQVTDASDLDVEVQVSASGVNMRDTGFFDLKTTGYVQLTDELNRFKLKWAAQPGKSVRIDIINLNEAPFEFRYVYGGGSVIEGISRGVKQAGASSLVTLAPVTVGTSRVQIHSENTDRREAYIYNPSATQPLYLGDNTVTAANGEPLPPLTGTYQDVAGAIYGIYSSGSESVRRKEHNN